MGTRLLLAAVDVYSLVLLARILCSWLPERARRGVFYEYLYALTEPVMRPFRRVLPPVGGMDLSPLLLFLLLGVLRHVLGRFR